MTQTKKRESNIELLRILAALGIVVLHYNNVQMGGGLGFVDDKSINKVILSFLEVLCICATDLFMVISGYFMANSIKRNYVKLVKLVLQVIFFSLVFYAIAVFNGVEIYSWRVLLVKLLPAHYFLILYCVTYIFSPYIVVMARQIDDKGLWYFVSLVFLIFSIYPLLCFGLEKITGEQLSGLNSYGMYGDSEGYCIVNFIQCWIYGYAIRRLGWKYGRTKSAVLFAITIIALFVAYMMPIGSGAAVATNYCCPIVILSAIFLFGWFKQINLGCNKIINALSRSTFTVILIHNKFLPYIEIEKYVHKEWYIMVIHIIVSALIIFMVCWLADTIYKILFNPMWKLVEKKVHWTNEEYVRTEKMKGVKIDNEI